MHSIPAATFFHLTWSWNPNQAYHIVRRWQKWVKTLPSSINSSIRLEYREGIITVNVIGLKVSSEPFTEWKTVFADLDPEVFIQQGSYLSTVPFWSAQPSLPFNKSRSKILPRPISKRVTHDIITYLEKLNRKKPNLRIFLNFDAFGGNFPDFVSSFPFRKAFGWWYFGIYWPYQTQDALALKLINEIYNKVSSHVSRHSYANATDYELGKTYLKAYYDGNVDRLIRVKDQHDPENIFRWRQSIPTSKKHKKCF
jgi:hypothetical protein